MIKSSVTGIVLNEGASLSIHDITQASPESSMLCAWYRISSCVAGNTRKDRHSRYQQAVAQNHDNLKDSYDEIQKRCRVLLAGRQGLNSGLPPDVSSISIELGPQYLSESGNICRLGIDVDPIVPS